jgi:uncharacterized protein
MGGRTIVLIAWMLIPLGASAASFDCMKATTQVEKMVCADAALSKLDEDLAAKFREAISKAKQGGNAELRKAQAAWLKSRNKCKEEPCIEGAYRARIAELSTTLPRYTFIYGKGWGVCEAYIKLLNATPANEEPPICDLKLDRVPGMREPDWEVLDVWQNLPLVHQIELLLGRGDPAPDRDLERWKAQLRARIDEQGQKPRLRRVRMALVSEKYFEVGAAEAGGPRRIPTGQVETVLAYDFDLNRCDREVRKARQGQSHRLGRDQTNLFVFDEASRQVMGSGGFALSLEGEPRVYADRLHYVYRAFGYTDSHGRSDSGGNLIIKRFEPTYSPLPGHPPYIWRELCRIRFDSPFPRQ